MHLLIAYKSKNIDLHEAHDEIVKLIDKSNRDMLTSIITQMDGCRPVFHREIVQELLDDSLTGI